VIDEIGLLSPQELQSLSLEISAYPPKIQLQIWILSKLDGEPIESLSIRATDKWKLGTKKEDRGALILIAKDDRAVRIEVGQGLEGDIPDALAGRIIDQVIVPAFRAGRFDDGLRLAARNLYSRAGGDVEALPRIKNASSRQSRQQNLFLNIIPFLVIVLIFGILPRLMMGRRRGVGGFWGGGGGFGGGGWGGGSGGGWSGGGGGFSGGGSSGNW